MRISESKHSKRRGAGMEPATSELCQGLRQAKQLQKAQAQAQVTGIDRITGLRTRPSDRDSSYIRPVQT